MSAGAHDAGEGEGADRLTPPQRVAVNADWMNENRRKQRAYEKKRATWAARFKQRDAPEDTANDFASAPEAIKSRGRRQVFDKRQQRFDF
jgi:hypothetical protein